MHSRVVAHSLSLNGVTKRYGPVTAVDDVTFTVPRGEFITLLGPSGSGKTTILMMIAGFVEPSVGEILLDDRPITRLLPEKRNFGMVFQGYALFPHMTVAENIGFPLKVRRMAVIEAKPLIDKVLELVRLGELADRMPKQLSGGQQQRVALARALVFRPDILLLDEPLGALDKKLRGEVQIELKQLHQRVGATFVYVTHDQEEALSMSDRIAIIRDGRIVQVGRPEELYERPATRFVADFLGESNFLRGVVKSADRNRIAFTVGGLTLVQSVDGNGVGTGETVLIALRPEKIAISARQSSANSNTICGEISHWNYYGTTIHFTVRTSELGDIAVSQPAWRNDVDPSEGKRVWLRWDADASVVVSED